MQQIVMLMMIGQCANIAAPESFSTEWHHSYWCRFVIDASIAAVLLPIVLSLMWIFTWLWKRECRKSLCALGIVLGISLIAAEQKLNVASDSVFQSILNQHAVQHLSTSEEWMRYNTLFRKGVVDQIGLSASFASWAFWSGGVGTVATILGLYGLVTLSAERFHGHGNRARDFGGDVLDRKGVGAEEESSKTTIRPI